MAQSEVIRTKNLYRLLQTEGINQPQLKCRMWPGSVLLDRRQRLHTRTLAAPRYIRAYAAAVQNGALVATIHCLVSALSAASSLAMSVVKIFGIVWLLVAGALLDRSQAQIWLRPQASSLSGGSAEIDFELMKASTNNPQGLCGTGCGCSFILQDALSATCNFLLPPPFVQLSVKLLIKSSDLINAGCAGITPIESCQTYSQSTVRKAFCPTPSLDFIGSVPFRLIYNGVACADSLQNMYNFFGVLNIEPMGGPISGGTQFVVNLLGYAFSKLPIEGDILCIFSTLNSTATTLSTGRSLCSPGMCLDVPNARFSCRSPPNGIAGVGFSLSFYLGNDVWLNDTKKYFTPYNNPVLSGIGAIRIGPHAGGTVVEIFGSGFVFFPSGKCMFGVQNSVFVFVNSTYGRCISPKVDRYIGSSEVVEVSISLALNGVDIVSSALRFVYYPDPFISGIFPQAIPAQGGAVLTVSGSNFVRDSGNFNLYSVYLGPNNPAAPYPASTTTRLVITTPPCIGGAGLAPVMVSVNMQQMSPDTNSTVACFVITSVQPSVATLIGQSVVSIAGSYLTHEGKLHAGGYTCAFTSQGSSTAIETPAQVDFRHSGSIVVCITPPLPLGLASLAVKIGGLASSLLPFMIINLATVTNLVPKIGPLSGSWSILVIGTYFENSESMRCKFTYSNGAAIVMPMSTFIDSSKMRCMVPVSPLNWGQSGDSSQAIHLNASVEVSVSVNGQQYSNINQNLILFAFLSTDPQGSPYGVTTQVSIGIKLDSSLIPALFCKFGNYAFRNQLRCSPLAISNNTAPSDCYSVSNGFVSSSSSMSILRCVAPVVPVQPEQIVEVHMSLSFDGESFFNGNGKLFRSNGFPARALFSVDSFSFFKEPSATALVPSIGPHQGGAILTILGNNFFAKSFAFDGTIFCRFGLNGPKLVAYFIGPGRLTCRNSPIMISTLSNVTYNVSETLARSKCDNQGLSVYSNQDGSSVVEQASYLNADYRLYISYNGVYFSDSTQDFYYYYISSIFPTLGPPTSSVNLQIQGANFGKAIDISCQFWLDIIVVADYDPAQGIVFCRTPEKPTDLLEDFLSVQVRLSSSAVFTQQGFTFAYYPNGGIIVTSIKPSYVAWKESVKIAISGANFVDSCQQLYCLFGILKAGSMQCEDRITCVRSIAMFSNSSHISCDMPAFDNVSSIGVYVTMNNGVFFNLASSLTFFGIETLFPLSGSIVGGLSLQIIGVNFPEVELVDSDNPLSGAQCLFYNSSGFLFSTSGARQNPQTRHCTCILPPAQQQQAASEIFVDIRLFTLDGAFTTKSRSRFQYFKVPRYFSISPSIGAVDGGTRVIISGQDFVSTPTAQCKFGTISVSASFVDSFVYSCLAPAVIQATTVFVYVSVNGQDYLPDAYAFVYALLPRVVSLYPNLLPLTNSSVYSSFLVTVRGVNFRSTPNLSCKFNLIYKIPCAACGSNVADWYVVPGIFVDASVIICPSKPSTRPDIYEVQISLDAQLYARQTNSTVLAFGSHLLYFYSVTGIGPGFINRFQGFRIIIDGDGWPSMAVDPTVSALCQSSEMQPTGSGLILNSVSARFDSLRKQYICEFNSSQARSLTTGRHKVKLSLGDSSIFTMTRPGVLDVSVSYEVRAADFSILSFIPIFGVTNGGFVLTIFGINFFRSNIKDGATVTLGVPSTVNNLGSPSFAQSPTVTYISDTCITAVAPRSPSGVASLPVALSINDVQFGISTQNFNYIDIPEVTSSYPPSISRRGSKITVFGRNFVPLNSSLCGFNCSSPSGADAVPSSRRPSLEDSKNMNCKFQSPVIVVTGTQLICDAPPASARLQENDATLLISITVDGNQWSLASSPVHYFDSNYVIPTAASVRGGVALTIYGDNLIAPLANNVLPVIEYSAIGVNTTSVICRWVSSSLKRLQIGGYHFGFFQCPSPVILLNLSSLDSFNFHDVNIRIRMNYSSGIDWAIEMGMPLKVFATMIVTSVTPSVHNAGGGGTMTLRGVGFKNSATITCRAHNSQNPGHGSFIDSTTIICFVSQICFEGTRMVGCRQSLLPPSEQGNQALLSPSVNLYVSVSINMQEFSDSVAPVIFISVVKINPYASTFNGGAIVTVYGINFAYGVLHTAKCVFKDFEVSAQPLILGTSPVNGTALICVAPVKIDYVVRLELKMVPDGILTADRQLFYYFSQFPLYLLYPPGGWIHGGMRLMMKLDSSEVGGPNEFIKYDEKHPIRVQFDFQSSAPVVVEAQILNSYVISCIVPQAAGLASSKSKVRVNMNGQHFSNSDVYFFYYQLTVARPGGGVVQKCPFRPGCNRGGEPCLPWQTWPDEPESSRYGNPGCDDGAESPVNFAKSRCNPLFVEGQSAVTFLGHNLYFRANSSILGPFFASNIVDKFDIAVGDVQVNTRVSFSSPNNIHQASFITNAYAGARLVVHNGIGAGESCRIASYDGLSQTAVLVYPCQPGNRATNLTTGSLIEIFIDVVPLCRLRSQGVSLESPITVPGIWHQQTSAVICRPDTADRSLDGRRFNYSKSVMFGRFPSGGSFTFSVEVSLAGSITVSATETIQRGGIPGWAKDLATGTSDASFTDSGELVAFQFYRQPCANVIYPYASPSQGGAWVTLSGSGFRYLNVAPQCKFGSSTIVSGDILSDKAIRCLSPQSFVPLTVTFSLNQVSFEPSNWLVTRDGVSRNEPQSQAVLSYFYITEMQPALGNALGGTLVYFKLNPEMDAIFALNAVPANEFVGYMQISALFGRNIAKCSPPPITGVTPDASYPVNDGATITTLGRIFQAPYIVCRTPPSDRVQTVQVSLQLYANSTFLNPTTEFFYHGNMQFSDFNPKMILEKGGSQVYVRGENFPNRAELSCAFGESNSTASFISTAQFLSSNIIVCAAPVKAKLASLSFFITTTGQQSESTSCSPDGCKELIGEVPTRVDYVTFYAQALITQISPESASIEGGTNFVVRGARVGALPVGSYTCRFGDYVLQGIIPIEDPTSMRCKILPGLNVGLYPVEISLNGYDYTQSAGKFVMNMFPSVEIFSLIPKYVPVGVSDQIVTVVGSNFQAKDVLNRGGTRSGVQIFISGDTVSAEFVDSNILRFVAPLRSSAVTLPVEVSMNVVDKTTSNLLLKYVVNSNSVTCPENCLNRGRCEKFFVEDLTSPTLEKQIFRCLCNPPYFGSVCGEGGFAMISFFPRVVLQTGGAVVRVLGFNVESSSTNRYQCKFGHQVVNSSAIQMTNGLLSVMNCSAPPLFLNGTVALSISIDNGISWEGHPVSHQISYMMLPLAALVEPSIAPFRGGTLVTVTSMLNTTFPTAPFTSDNCINEPFCNYQLLLRHSNMCCKIGGSLSDVAYFRSIFQLVCQVPAYNGALEYAQTSIQSKLDVSMNGVEFLGASLDFLYALPQTYIAIVPSVGSTQGGTLVTLLGSGFLSTQFLNCKFGVALSITRLLSTHEILLLAPFVALPSTVEIQCTINGQQWDIAGMFQYENKWTVMSFFPALGPESGNTLVTVTGSNFASSSNIQCKFGSYLSRNSDVRAYNFTNGAVVLSSTTMVCLSPPNFIERGGITMQPKSECSGHFVQGRRRNLCVPLSFNCEWKTYDASTLYLSCTSTPFGEAIVFTPYVVDGTLVDTLPTNYELKSGENLHPDLPLRNVVDLWITIDGQTWASIIAPPGQKARKYSFTETINVTLIDPDVTLIGSTRSAVVVRGEGFYPQHPDLGFAGYPAVRCLFLDAVRTYSSLPAEFIDPFAISCPIPSVNDTLSPSALALPMKIVVEINGQQRTNNTNLFYFARLWKVYRTIPSLSPMTGGISVTVIGPYFRKSTKLNCKFGDVLASSVLYINETAIMCRTPSMSTASLVPLEVTLDGFFWSVDQVQFEVYAVRNALFFGSASYQQLGFGNSIMQTRPQVLDFMKTLDVSQIALGQQHSLAIASVQAQDDFGPVLRKGVLYAWGDNFVGQLGHGDYTPRGTPVAVRGCLQNDLNGNCIFNFFDLNFVSVACGSFHSLVVSDQGVLYAWGWNTKGQLGQGLVYTGGNSPTPLVVHALRNQGAFIRRVAGGFAHTVAEGYISDPDQSFIWTWGANDKGQLGLGDFVARSLPTRIPTLLTLDNYPISVQDLKTGLFHTVILSTEGDVFTVGLHSSGQLGRCRSGINGATGLCLPLPARVGSTFQSYATFDRVSYLSPLKQGRVATSIAVGSLHTAATEAGGDLFVWGNNEKGQLGLGVYGGDTNQLLPTPVTLLGTKAAVCGNNFFALSGTCVSSELYSLQQTRAVSVGAGGYHTFVTRGTQRGYGYKGSPVFAKSLFAFGNNEQGQLGLGGQITQMNSIVSVPSVVQFATNTLGVLFIGLQAGFQHSAVLQTCPPSPIVPCSRQGFCSPDSTCTCYQGFRGFECQFQCDGVRSGGASNICYKNGNSSASLLISDYFKAAVIALNGPAMFQRLKTAAFEVSGSRILTPDFSFGGSGAFNSSTSPMPGDLTIRLSITSITNLIKSIKQPVMAKLVDKWTHPVLSPVHSRTLFPQSNNSFSFQVALRILESLVQDAFSTDTVAGYFKTRQSQIKRVWDNTKIECGMCDYVQIAFSSGISPGMVEGVFKMLSDVDCSSGSCSGLAIAKIASEFFIGTDVVIQVLNSMLVNCPACRIQFFDSGCMFDGSCVCANGWTGDECKQECAPNYRNPCSGNGRCLDDGSCDCRDEYGNDIGWRGSICNIKCKGTVNGKPCSGNGVCLSNGNCQCFDGYRGDGCELSCPGLIQNPNPLYANDPTKMLVCTGRGDCLSTEGSAATCNCLFGYVGFDCAKACEGLIFQVTATGVSRLAISNCSGHGMCKSTLPTPADPGALGSCSCDRGWRLSNCSRECAGGAKNPCSGSNQGTCTETGSCICEPGWRGASCSRECAGGFSKPCNNHGICTPFGNCSCFDGYLSFDCGFECEGGAGNPCNRNGLCQSDGSCECYPAFRGRACDVECPGTNGQTDGFVCLGRGLCNAEGQCECTGVYAGDDCSQFTAWFILTVAFIIIVTIIFVTWTTHKIIKFREKLARRQRRAIKQKPKNVDEPATGAGNVIKRRAFQRQEIRKYMETGPTEEDIATHKKKQLAARTVGAADDTVDATNPVVAPVQPPPVTMRPSVRSALGGLELNPNASDSEEEMDRMVVPRAPLEPNVRPRVPQLGVEQINPPAPVNPPQTHFVRVAKGGGKLSDRALASTAQVLTPPRTTGIQISRFPSTDLDDTEEEPDARNASRVSDSDD